MLFRITGIQRQILTALCLYMGQIICGYNVAWTGPVIPMLRDLELSPLPYLLTESQLSLVATMVYLGGIPSPYVMGWLSNTRGRKPCLIIGGIIAVVAHIILTTTKNLFMLYAGRFIAGVSMGVITVMNVVYIGEMASTNIRGVLLTAIGIFHTVGAILLFSVGPFLTYHGTTYVGLGLGSTYIICLLTIPESPIYYILKGKDEQVKATLQDLGRLEDTEKLLTATKKTVGTSTKQDWMELFVFKNNRKALFIVVTINILQHCSGVLAILFFSAAIFDMAGTSLDFNISMIIMGFFQLSGSTITPFFIERIGRKIILLISTATCSLSMFILGLYFYLDYIGNSVTENLRWLPLVVLALFYIGYDSGLGIIPNAIIGEVFTSNVRSKGSAVAMTSSWLFGFGINTAFGALLETVGGHTAFWFFSCTCACAFIFTLFFIPETRGKTLLEIQDFLNK